MENNTNYDFRRELFDARNRYALAVLELMNKYEVSTDYAIECMLLEHEECEFVLSFAKLTDFSFE